MPRKIYRILYTACNTGGFVSITNTMIINALDNTDSGQVDTLLQYTAYRLF
jgi:hypothetical protein